MQKVKRGAVMTFIIVVCCVLIGGTPSLAASFPETSQEPAKQILVQDIQEASIQDNKEEKPQISFLEWLGKIFPFSNVLGSQAQEGTGDGAVGFSLADPVTALTPAELLSGGEAEGVDTTDIMSEEPETEGTAEGAEEALEEMPSEELLTEEAEKSPDDVLAEDAAVEPDEETQQVGQGELPGLTTPGGLADGLLQEQQEAGAAVQAEPQESVLALYDPAAVMVPYAQRSFKFVVMDDGISPAPVESASLTVTVGGKTQTAVTNKSGQVSIAMDDSAPIGYTLSKNGYTDVTGTLTSGSADTVNVTMKKLYNVTFTVTDGAVPLRGALVLFNGVEKTTDDTGTVVFTANNGAYSYDVSHVNFTGVVSGKPATVADSNLNIPVSLSGGNRVAFTVKDDVGNAVAGAVISVEGAPPQFSTGSTGVAYTWLLPQEYKYTVEHDGHVGMSGSHIVTAGVNEVTVTLDRMGSNVAFVVKNASGEILPGATVVVDGKSVTTGDDGIAVVSLIVPGTYQVSVSKARYELYEAQLAIDPVSLSVEVTLIAQAAQPTPVVPTPAPPSNSSSSSTTQKPKGSGSSSNSGKYQYTDEEEDAKASPSPSPSPSPSASVSPSPSPTPTVTPEPEEEQAPSLNLGFCLMDTDWNPIADAAVELHSEVQHERTDENGIVFFLDVELGQHNLYVMDDAGEVIAQKTFELVSSKELELELTSSGVDKLHLGDSSSTVAVDVLLDGGKLNLVKLHEEDPREAMTEEEKQEAQEENSNLIILLAVCVACLIVAIAIVFAAVKLIKKPRHKNEESSLQN
ncbi:hypothetical protein LJC56_07765 [Christensenellaceae bacterium OttesenSCG-928-K19]|nr:hypothetical protein [Christensenellaceae bacterium OttesenSCG-928-K19]